MNLGAVSIMQFHLSVVIGSQLANQHAAARFRRPSDNVPAPVPEQYKSRSRPRRRSRSFIFRAVASISRCLLRGSGALYVFAKRNRKNKYLYQWLRLVELTQQDVRRGATQTQNKCDAARNPRATSADLGDRSSLDRQIIA